MTEDKKDSLDASCERLAIPPDAHEMMLTDINEKGLEELDDQEGIANLSPAGFPSLASCERLAIPPDAHEMMLTDINEKGLEELGLQEGIVNLSSAEFPSEAFPVDGVIYGENNRLMVCLPCRRVKMSAATVNVWFIVDTGSNCNFLAKETIKALIREEDRVPKALRVAIQNPDSQIECRISPPDKHFSDANVLGMEALRMLKLSIVIDWDHKVFKLVKQ